LIIEFATLFRALRARVGSQPVSTGEDVLAGPIRGELFGAEHLGERARELAQGMTLSTAPQAKRTPLLARLRQTADLLARAHTELTALSDRGVEVGPAAEWFLDNYYVLREHMEEVRESLPRGYYRELATLDAGTLSGYPRIYEVAITLISHSEGRIDEDNVTTFVGAFQDVDVLELGELWAIPAMLRLGLIENVRRMTLRTTKRLREIARADQAADRITRAAAAGGLALETALARFTADAHTLSDTFVARFLHQLRTEGGTLPAVVRLQHWIAEEALGAEEAANRATQRLALTQVVMANSITSLRALERIEWRGFVEAQSRVDHVLRTDPLGVYAQMTFETRDAYRHVVERIARRTERVERQVAQMAIDLAAAAAPAPEALEYRTHVGYYLIDDGRFELERMAGYSPSLDEVLLRMVRRFPAPVYLVAGPLALVGALMALFWLAGPAGVALWFPLLLLGIMPASELAITLVNRIVTALLPPRVLPRLDLRLNGVPPEHRTAVVIPTLFSSVEEVDEALENLEVQFLANRETHLHFAVLSDFMDAAAQSTPGDAAILKAAVEGVEALNLRYAGGRADTFFLFHRPRRWNPRENVWMGWERKRGKLGEFNRFVLTGERAGFSTVIGATEVLRSVKFVITLDSDTVLPPDGAPDLIGSIAHPLNRAVYDAALGRVTRGHGILQPRVGVWLPSARRSAFATIYSGHPGVDPYTTAVSDVYQDLFGEGSYTGKGIYDVAIFERATQGRFPENTLLSHDLIEGGYARAGLVTDVIVYDDYPSRYLTFSRRKHRWIRGDWQLLPWLGGSAPGPGGPEPNRLSLLSHWKIVDNLRRSGVEIGQLGFLLGGWLLLPVSMVRWTLLGVGIIAAPWIVTLLVALVRPPLDKSMRAYYGAIGADARTSVGQVLLAVTFLPHQAWRSADAIVRTLWRLCGSRRRMLEWQSAVHSERATGASSRGTWLAMWPVSAGAVGLGAWLTWRAVNGGMGGSAGSPWWFTLSVLPIVLLWVLSPEIAHRLSGQRKATSRALAPDVALTARRYAALHWNYFDTFVTEETGWLAPDNFQGTPSPVVAMRTSPTNMGLHLLSIVSAHDLGFITLDDMIERLEQTSSSMKKLDRLHGHYFNWYDLGDQTVLEPPYVSTVDSGNLAAHLIALRQACLSLIQSGSDAVRGSAGQGATHSPEDARNARLLALANWAHDDAMALDFRVLFDERRELFSIGLQQQTNTLDSSYYDLLASEARLASFFAIAKNDVPSEHWFRLGRSLTYAAGAPALVSWSGSMFEYLMPLLVMRALPGTVLAQSYQGVIDRQVADGTSRGVPWGISESAYNVRDRHFTYQYRPFGVADLALKRGLGREVVVAPYATALATMVDPGRAFQNLARLEGLGALGPYGFRDAVDYTRPDVSKDLALVDAYMAHHIGMSLVALTNALKDDLWQHRFHRDPLIMAAELLLHERVPREVVHQVPYGGRADDELPAAEVERPVVRAFFTPDTPTPHVAFLGHHPYTVMLTNGGAGYSRYDTLAVNRWRADGTRDSTGQFCYIKDLASGRVWSSAHQPTCAPADAYRAALGTEQVIFERTDGDFITRTEIAVLPEDSAEVRRVTITNLGRGSRELELTSYGEVVMAPPDADQAHPAFGNLFVETAWHPWCNAITATRRPRSATEDRTWLVHLVDWDRGRVGAVSCETDRARFLGRGRSTADPMALEQDGPLSGTAGSVLDPIFAIRTRVKVPAGQSVSVAFTTLVATTSERAFALADRYRDPHAAQRALDLAWTSSRVELHDLNLSTADAAVFQELAGHLLYGHPVLHASQQELCRNHGSQPLLWGFGVSGDLPVLLATIQSSEGLVTLRSLLAAHRFWSRRGLMVDLVILDEHPPTYLQDLGDRITAAVHAMNDPQALDRPGGVFVRRRDLLIPDAERMLRATARLHIPCDGRSLGRILAAAIPAIRPSAAESLTSSPATHPPQTNAHPERATELAPDESRRAYANGMGRLTPENDYELQVQGDAVPPAPWSNVIANPFGGFAITERGGGFVWAENSYFMRLTPWHNDPVSDPVSDVVYLQDADSGDTWCATPAPIRTSTLYTVVHGAGSTSFEHVRDGIGVHYTVGMAEGVAVKVGRLRLTNTTTTTRRIVVTTYVEWVLGALREQGEHQVRTWFKAAGSAIFAQNTFDPHFAHWTAFHAITEPVQEYTGRRRTFLGRNGNSANPAALRPGATLSGTTGARFDPCAALRCVIELAPGETRTVGTLLGAAPTEAEACATLDALGGVQVIEDALDGSMSRWAHRLGVVTVQTPDPDFDAMLNRWSLYQALSCRMWGRSAVYQSSGAYGFRDQLQDVMAFVYSEPAVAREHILRASGRQFLEGDVQHWWHPHTGRGVRTRFSDDLVWLPYVVDQYVTTTADTAILDEFVPFLFMPELAPDEHEVYDLPLVTDEHASVYEHCLRALRRASTRGVHGLPLIGGGDWNDGMNRVGVGGEGESIWLAWFLITTLRAFAEHADARGDVSAGQELRAHAADYAVAVETHGWDGDWYRRAYYDDGTPLGSQTNAECRIDSIAQSWSVISDAGSPVRQTRAMESLEAHLVQPDHRLLLLLAPPFDQAPQDPGYIKGYLPGVRENGAQYTHAALWAVLANAMRGEGEQAFAQFQMINPLTHTQTPEDLNVYKVEPYVVAADVYTAEGQVGRGGWTWYTGSASWMYRVGLEGILGVEKRGETLRIAPRAPASWPTYELRYRVGQSTYHITVRNSGGNPRQHGTAWLDGVRLEGGVIPLVDDGVRHVVVVDHGHA
jgi:cyclic beta-1,2-glucan synthetase